MQAYENRETEVLEFIHDEQKIVVFGFRGTEPFSITDWLGNFNLQPGAFDINGTPVSIHKGFVKRYGYISSWFENEYMKVITILNDRIHRVWVTSIVRTDIYFLE